MRFIGRFAAASLLALPVAAHAQTEAVVHADAAAPAA